MIPTLSFAVDRSHDRIKEMVMNEFNVYAKENLRAFSMDLAPTVYRVFERVILRDSPD